MLEDIDISGNICSSEIVLALEKSENKWKSLIQNSSDMITLLSQDGIVTYESPSVLNIVGYRPEELESKIIFNYIHPHDLPNVLTAFKSIMMEYGTSKTVEFRFLHKNGEWCYLEAVGQSMLNDPNVASIVINSRNITERRLTEKKLNYYATYDSLTNLYNRHHFSKKINEIINYEKSSENYHFALLILDIDRFKLINDSLGHTVGDHLLVAISKRLENCVRGEDLIARLGGDEFVVIICDLKAYADAIRTAERIVKSLSESYLIEGNEIYGSASIGIVLSKSYYKDSEDLLRMADIALYKAKGKGRNCYEIFDENMHFEALNQLQFENDLRQAIKLNEFFLLYQPIYELENKNIVGYEALIRWNCSKRGLVNPSCFIKIAEETGLIIDIGDFVIQEACKVLKKWRELTNSNELKIHINCSTKQLLQPEFFIKFSEIIDKYQICTSSLIIEITESVLMEDTPQISSTLSSLTALGIKLCLDDFGTGYSSLSYLHRFPVKSLKIDRSFVEGLSKGHRNLAIVKAIINMSIELGIDVIAEGINSEEVSNILLENSCTLGQGYKLGKPKSQEETYFEIMRFRQF